MSMTNEQLSIILQNLLGPKVSPQVSEAEPEAKPERPKRCQHTECKKKLMLSDLACKCENYYCQGHRFAPSHSCTFDYRAAADKVLEKQLVKTVSDRLERI
jgi:predicted nucleic acid binding AN1-type Zn finger protein